jgi:hypothetical protein
MIGIDFNALSRWVIPGVTLILVIATLASLALSVWTLRRSNRMKVELERLLMLRDLSLRNSLLAALPPGERERVARIVDEAFAEGSRVWETKHLTTILGDEGVRRLRDAKLGAETKERAL